MQMMLVSFDRLCHNCWRVLFLTLQADALGAVALAHSCFLQKINTGGCPGATRCLGILENTIEERTVVTHLQRASKQRAVGGRRAGFFRPAKLEPSIGGGCSGLELESILMMPTSASMRQ